MVALVSLCFATFAKPESRDHVNQETVSIVDGSFTCSYYQLVFGMASLFDNGYDLRVAPILGRDPLRVTEDSPYLKGVDVGFLQADVLDFQIEHNIEPNSRDVFRYRTALHDEDFHVVARPGMTVEALELPYDQGLQQQPEGKIDTITRVSGAPTRCLKEISKDEALQLLDIPLVGAPYKDTTISWPDRSRRSCVIRFCRIGDGRF